jgi:alpha-glucosidase
MNLSEKRRRLFVMMLMILVGPSLLICQSVANAQVAPPSGQGSAVQVDQVTAVEPLPDGISLGSGSATLRITAVRDDILRIRISRSSTFPPNHSWAVLPGILEHGVAVTQAAGETPGFSTSALTVRIARSPLRLIIQDRAGRVISADAVGRPAAFHGEQFRIYKTMSPDEHYYGLGDKAGALDRTNRAFQMWNTDAYGWEESTDPLYKDIPFFLSVNKDGASYGVLLDNTYRSSFDFGTELRDTLSFGAEGGDLDYYLIYGPEPKQVLSRFADFVGHAALPPRWAFGFQQSRYSYETEARVQEIANTFRKKKIPLDVLYLDIDYQIHNRPFTINPETFPTFNQMVSGLAAQGIHLVTITDLHIASLPGAGYKPYDTGIAGDHFVHKPDGTVFVGEVWPGPSVFPDFTRQSTREWWGGLYKDFYMDRGIGGFWNDMNEPSVFKSPTNTMPLDVLHRIDEPGQPVRTTTHREIHNVLGMENSRATYEGLLRLNPNLRPFVLTRATYAGGQRYAATWTGDNAATWNQWRISTPQLINIGLSGQPFVGDDIGGFRGSPMPDLLTRWLELGVFNPIYRDHTDKGTADQEPWVHGPQHEAIRRRYIELRYQLMPYIYSLAEEAARTGIPMMRPLFLEYPREEDQQVDKLQSNSEFMFGRSLLVAPQMSEIVDAYRVGLPKGEWFDYWTGKRVHDPSPLTITPQLDVLPVFVRAGSIIPQQAVVQSTMDLPQGPLELRVYPGANCQGTLFLDDGVSFDYQRGKYLRENFSCEVNAAGIKIRIAPHEGQFQPWWTQIQLTIAGVDHTPKRITVNGTPAQNLRPDDSGSLSLTAGDPPSGSEIEIVY